MGVPKFFRWCAERYPCVISPFKDSPPPVDNLYLDMNGIIHNCTHPNDIDATRRSPTEKEMIQGMFTYLEKLFNAIQPRKHFLLAVDGVAPRAKMNQQRQRRYRSAYEMMVAREEALTLGEEVPDEKDVFDSNCITPGTPFMVRVSQEFQYFITMKLATDAAWQNCKVIFSGHDCPGEGEHKIVDFIRRRKMQPGYDPNETHCMYGLDADLVMLALATHEPHFVLLREVVNFGPSSRKERMKQEEDEAKGFVMDKAFHKADEFVLLHIGVLRDYLEMDVRNRLQSSGCTPTFDLERVVDDFVFMCYFIGNDFLPSIPTIGINDGSMLTMLQLYVDYILSKGLFLTKQGTIDWRATELWLGKLGELEFETIRTRQQEEADFQRMRARRDPSHEVPTAEMPYTSIGEYKERHYGIKHEFKGGWSPNSDDMQALRLHYIEGLTWVMGYYYQGVPSWKWYFPHYYAPMASDLVNLPAIAAKVHFDLASPFMPHQQLLSVLPPMSYRSIPKAYWPLLKSKSSPLMKYFPDHIQIDREGTRAPWEGIVLIPFIEEDVLLAAYNSVQANVLEEDRINNRLGPSLLFSFDSKSQPYTLQDSMFGDLKNVTVAKTAFKFPECDLFVPALCPGVLIHGNQLEGFASFQSKRPLLTPSYEVGAVSIFGMDSRKESMILNLQNFSQAKSAGQAAVLVGKEVLVGFPHYKRARVSSVSDAHFALKATYTTDGAFCGTEKSEKNRDETTAFLKEVETHKKYMKAKLGVNVENINILVYVHRFAGMKVSRKARIVRQFTSTETCYPMELICMLEDIKMREDARYTERDRDDMELVGGTRCVFIGPEPKNKKGTIPVYGSNGYVVSSDHNNFTVCLKVLQEVQKLPPQLISYANQSNWVAMHEAASELGIKSRTFTTICSSLITSSQFGSREIGLCIKFTGRCLARVGYAKVVQRRMNPWYIGNVDIFARMEQDDNDMGHHLVKTEKGDFVGNSSVHRGGTGTWYFSRAAMELIAAYAKKFRPLIKMIEAGDVNYGSIEPQLFMTDQWRDRAAEDVLDEIEAFINECGVMNIPMITATEDAFPQGHLAALEDSLAEHQSCPVKEVQLRQVVYSHLYFPVTRSTGGHLVPLPIPKEQTFRLGARVVNCRATGTTPFGAHGTIVRLLASGREAEVLYDEPFTGGTRLDGRLRENRAAISKLSTLLVVAGGSEDSQSPPTAGHAGNSGANNNAAAATGAVQALMQTIAKQQQRQSIKSPATVATPAAAGGEDFLPKPRSATAVVAEGASRKEATPPAIAHIAATTAAAAFPTAVSLTATGKAGGINISDLITHLPGATPSPNSALQASPSSRIAIPPPKSAVQQQQRSEHPSTLPQIPQPTPAPLAKSAAQTVSPSDPQSQQQQPARKKSIRVNRAIPDEFVSGKVRITHNESGMMFRKWMEAFTKAELEKLANEAA